MASAFLCLIDSVDVTDYVLWQGAQATKAKTIQGRADFTLMNYRPAIGDVVLFKTTDAEVSFVGVVRGINTEEHPTASGDYFCRVTAYDSDMGAYSTSRGRYCFSNYDEDQTYQDIMVAVPDVWDAWWRLGEASGTTASDEMGALDLTYVGSPTLGATGALARIADTAVTLNGSTQYAEASGGLIAGSVHLTVSARFKTATKAADQTIYSERDSTDAGQQVCRFFIDTNGRPSVRLRGTSGATDTIAPASGDWSDGEWHHVLFSQTSNTNMDIYIDGTLRATTSSMTFTNTYSGIDTVSVGRDYHNGDYFTGTLDEVAVAHGTDFAADDALVLFQCWDIRRDYMSMTEDIVNDGTTTTSTYQVKTEDFITDVGLGPIPGDRIAVSNSTFGITGNVMEVTEVTYRWLNKDTPIMEATLGDEPIRLPTAFP